MCLAFPLKRSYTTVSCALSVMEHPLLYICSSVTTSWHRKKKQKTTTKQLVLLWGTAPFQRIPTLLCCKLRTWLVVVELNIPIHNTVIQSLWSMLNAWSCTLSATEQPLFAYVITLDALWGKTGCCHFKGPLFLFSHQIIFFDCYIRLLYYPFSATKAEGGVQQLKER